MIFEIRKNFFLPDFGDNQIIDEHFHLEKLHDVDFLEGLLYPMKTRTP